MLHTMTTVSVWCWLLATLMRYVAVYHPQMHLSRWRLGYRSLGSVIFVSALMNCWVPITAMTGNGLCVQVCNILGRIIKGNPSWSLITKKIQAYTVAFELTMSFLICFSNKRNVISLQSTIVFFRNHCSAKLVSIALCMESTFSGVTYFPSQSHLLFSVEYYSDHHLD
jgi:hypothetical protein